MQNLITLYSALGQVIVARPTIGSNVEEVRNKNIKFQVWDLGGQENLRQAWSTYYANTHASLVYNPVGSDLCGGQCR